MTHPTSTLRAEQAPIASEDREAFAGTARRNGKPEEAADVDEADEAARAPGAPTPTNKMRLEL